MLNKNTCKHFTIYKQIINIENNYLCLIAIVKCVETIAIQEYK